MQAPCPLFLPEILSVAQMEPSSGWKAPSTIQSVTGAPAGDGQLAEPGQVVLNLPKAIQPAPKIRPKQAADNP